MTQYDIMVRRVKGGKWWAYLRNAGTVGHTGRHASKQAALRDARRLVDEGWRGEWVGLTNGKCRGIIKYNKGERNR